MNDLTVFNFDSVDNGKAQTQNSGNRLTDISNSISSIKSNISAKIASRCGAASALSGAISTIDGCKQICTDISSLCDRMLELYKNVDYSMTGEIMKAFDQSLLLFELGFLTLEDLQNLYQKKFYAFDENGRYVEATPEMMADIYSKLPFLAAPLGGRRGKEEYMVVDPITGASTRLQADCAFRFQAVVNILSECGIHVPLGGGWNKNHKNPHSYHVEGLAHDFDTGHSININYNDGANEVTLRQYDDETKLSIVIQDSSSNVFYNTIDCSIDKMLEGHDYNRGLYAKIPAGTEIPEKYQKYIVNDLNNVVQSTDVLQGQPNKDNLSLVSIDGQFVDMEALYADAGMEMNRPLDIWPSQWTDYEAHHVQMIKDDTVYPRLYDDTQNVVSEYEALQYLQINAKLQTLG